MCMCVRACVRACVCVRVVNALSFSLVVHLALLRLDCLFKREEERKEERERERERERE